MNIVEKTFAKKWLHDNGISIEQECSQEPVFDAVLQIELNNGVVTFATRNLDDFIFSCIVKNRIPYSKFPSKYKNNVNFVSNVCYAMPSILNEIYDDNPTLFERIVATNTSLMYSSLVNKDVKKALRKNFKVLKNRNQFTI